MWDSRLEDEERLRWQPGTGLRSGSWSAAIDGGSLGRSPIAVPEADLRHKRSGALQRQAHKRDRNRDRRSRVLEECARIQPAAHRRDGWRHIRQRRGERCARSRVGFLLGDRRAGRLVAAELHARRVFGLRGAVSILESVRAVLVRCNGRDCTMAASAARSQGRESNFGSDHARVDHTRRERKQPHHEHAKGDPAQTTGWTEHPRNRGRDSARRVD